MAFVDNVSWVKAQLKTRQDSRVLPVSTLVKRTFPAVFGVRSGERVLLLTDAPSDKTLGKDEIRKGRIAMLSRWKTAFERMGAETRVGVYEETGKNNSPLPEKLVVLGEKRDAEAAMEGELKRAGVIVAMNRFSATAPLTLAVKGGKGRVASMPGVTVEMEGAMSVDYAEIQAKARQLKGKLAQFSEFEVTFNLAQGAYVLVVDARGRTWHADDGACRNAGDMINFPSGEVYMAPVEGVYSKTGGSIPVFLKGRKTPLILHVEKNMIQVEGRMPKEFRETLLRKPGNPNIAEFAFGLNGKARWQSETPTLEREKALGIHWAHGISEHLGGTTGFDAADVHQDYVYAVKDKRVKIFVDGIKAEEHPASRIALIDNSRIVY